MKASIIVNPLKDPGYEVAKQAAAILMQAGVSVYVQEPVRFAMPAGVLSADDKDLYGGSDFLVTLGGDGTILAAARGSGGRAPILGVNLGHKGFLTEVERGDLEDGLLRAVRGEYTLEKRLMLQATVFDDKGYGRSHSLALNDFYITGGTARIVRVEARLGSTPVGKYAADGLLISSPTGSTGYSLSAGGPVVAPEMQCMLLTPVCAHTLRVVPLVIPASETVTVQIIGSTREILLYADGEEEDRAYQGWRVEISKADIDTEFIRFGNKSFYGLLRDKLAEWND